MIPRAFATRRCLFFALFLILVGKSLSAEESTAFGVPRSDVVIQGKIELPSGQVVKFGSREGTFLTVEPRAGVGGEKVGIAFALQRPFSTSLENSVALLQPVEITREPEGEGARIVTSEAVRIRFERVRALNLRGESYSFKLTGVELQYFGDSQFLSSYWKYARENPGEVVPGGDLLEQLYGGPSQTSICISCGDYIVCATSKPICDDNGGRKL